MPAENKTQVQGITLVELLAALAAVAVLLSFAAAPLERMSARVDVDIAHKNISNMLQLASRSAANHKLPVVISLSEKLGRTHLEARYSYRWRNLRLDSIPSYSLPERVNAVLGEGLTNIRLEKDGSADQRPLIRIYSQVNPDYVVHLAVERADTSEQPFHAVSSYTGLR